MNNKIIVDYNNYSNLIEPLNGEYEVVLFSCKSNTGSLPNTNTNPVILYTQIEEAKGRQINSNNHFYSTFYFHNISSGSSKFVWYPTCDTCRQIVSFQNKKNLTISFFDYQYSKYPTTFDSTQEWVLILEKISGNNI